MGHHVIERVTFALPIVSDNHKKTPSGIGISLSNKQVTFWEIVAREVAILCRLRWTRGVSAQESSAQGLAAKFGFTDGHVVQELGLSDDCDQSVSQAVATVAQLVDPTYEDVVDGILLWFREEDGDLVDALMDALTELTETGVIWLMTPKAGRPGHIEPSDIADAAPTAGLATTSTINAAPHWQGTRLVSPRSRR